MCTGSLTCAIACPKALKKSIDWRYCIVAPLVAEAPVAILAHCDQFAVCDIEANESVKSTSVPLYEQPFCVCHDPRSRLFAVCTVRGHQGEDQGVVRFLRDEAPYTDVHHHFLEPLETPLCCSLVCLKCDIAGSCFVIGTAFSTSEFEPAAGRVLVFSSDTAETIPTTLFILEMDGAVYDIAAIRASFLVCAVNHSVHVYNTHIVDVDGQPRLEAVYDGLVVALKVRCCGNLIIVGDIVRSVIVLRFDTNDVQLVEVTRDYNTSWICALEILVDGRLIIAEAGGDLLALGRRCSHSDISKGPCLGPLARMRLGDVVTCFASGLLTSRKSTRSATPLFFGCVSGGIGCIFSIDISKYRLLERLSFAIPPRVTTVDGTFLGVRDTVATTSRAGFIDGEIVEQFLDLPDQAKHQILDRLNLGSDVPETTIQQLTHTFEHVRQLH